MLRNTGAVSGASTCNAAAAAGSYGLGPRAKAWIRGKVKAAGIASSAALGHGRHYRLQERRPQRRQAIAVTWLWITTPPPPPTHTHTHFNSTPFHHFTLYFSQSLPSSRGDPVLLTAPWNPTTLSFWVSVFRLIIIIVTSIIIQWRSKD